jgi:hypothetical protein
MFSSFFLLPSKVFQHFVAEWIFNCPQEIVNTLLLLGENFEEVFKKLLTINVKSNLRMLDNYSYFKKLKNKTQIGC